MQFHLQFRYKSYGSVYRTLHWVLAVFRWKRTVSGHVLIQFSTISTFKYYTSQWLKISNSKVYNSWTFQKGFFTHLCSSNNWSGTLKTLPMLRNQASIGWFSCLFCFGFYFFFKFARAALRTPQHATMGARAAICGCLL